jgi:hypothetical protein
MAFPLLAAVGAGLLLGGGILGEIGRQKELNDQAFNQERNAEFFREQQKQIEIKGLIDVDNFDRESVQFIGSEVSTIAKSGVDLSGTLLSRIANDSARFAEQHNQIIFQSEFEQRLAQIKIDQSLESAADLRASARSPLPFLGTLLGAGGSLAVSGAFSKPPTGSIGGSKKVSSSFLTRDK